MSDAQIDIIGLGVLLADLLSAIDPQQTPDTIRAMLGNKDPTDILGNALNTMNASSVEDMIPVGLQPLVQQALELYNNG